MHNNEYSKNSLLSDKDFKKYKINKNILKYLFLSYAKSKKKRSEFKVLDYGCGKGRSVFLLQKLGFDVHGVDIDESVIINSKAYFKSKKAFHSLTVLDSEFKTKYEDETFDFIFSSQVFEHISDISGVTKEISRISKNGSSHFHVFPSKYHIFEAHLGMPLVHWLPKNLIRYLAIYFFVLIGLEPKWSELKQRNISQRVDEYYNYSTEKTFYRNISVIKHNFSNNNFISRLVYPKSLSFFSFYRKNSLFSRMIIFVLSRFVSVNLLSIKKNNLKAKFRS